MAWIWKWTFGSEEARTAPSSGFLNPTSSIASEMARVPSTAKSNGVQRTEALSRCKVGQGLLLHAAVGFHEAQRIVPL